MKQDTRTCHLLIPCKVIILTRLSKAIATKKPRNCRAFDQNSIDYFLESGESINSIKRPSILGAWSTLAISLVSASMRFNIS